MRLASANYPDGVDFTLPLDPSTKLSVYTGELVLHAHINARPGDHLLEGVLRYQACDTNSCYPPRKAPVAIDVIAR